MKPKRIVKQMSEADRIIQAYEKAAAAGDETGYVDCSYAGLPRWKLSRKYIEFECGCVSERYRELNGMMPWDPVIFVNLPEQAVYLICCDKHIAYMNYRLGMGGFKDFAQWKLERRKTLVGV